MNEPKHTPGPWTIIQNAPQNPKSRYVIGARKSNGFATYVCTIKTEKHLITDHKTEANARLIAAAPELLAALEVCEYELSEAAPRPHARQYAIEAARAAIAKATGEPQI